MDAYDPIKRNAELIDALTVEAQAWAAMAQRQRKLVESYTERRRYPKRKNRLASNQGQ